MELRIPERTRKSPTIARVPVLHADPHSDSARRRCRELAASLGVALERHKQLDVRVKVSPVPYARDVREGYHEGWRTRQS